MRRIAEHLNGPEIPPMDRAKDMSDAGDRATMLRLASEYERRAGELDLRGARNTQ